MPAWASALGITVESEDRDGNTFGLRRARAPCMTLGCTRKAGAAVQLAVLEGIEPE